MPLPEIVLKPSLIPILFVVQLLAIWLTARHAKRRGEIKSTGWIVFFIVLLLVWGAISTGLALSGVYVSKPFLEAYPTLWLPFIPVVLVMSFLMLSGSAREAVRGLIDGAPVKAIIGIHVLRILAIGTLVKASQGVFSMSFALWVGIPDMAFGATAVIMYGLAAKQRIGIGALMVWNLLGVLVILPGAPIVGQRGLPGLFHALDEIPSMVTLYEFPMVLAPSLVVPIFVMMNLLVVIRLMERMIWGEHAFRAVAV